ncbi:MAG TPA: hypothetical protein VKB68_01780 [Stellaceae bacterium]|nr:hypothetical protein [Stellaceae bacterium]
MPGHLRRRTLVPDSASAVQAAPAAEFDAIPSLSADLLARHHVVAPAAGGGLLCAKGSAAVSRWRSYDHKEVFEPAQAAFAPPSDADEMGSWLKYEGPAAAPADRAKAVVDEEHPTAWFKYETKPAASLLGSLEKHQSKPQIELAESAPSAAPTIPEPIALVVAAPEPLEAEPKPATPEPTVVVAAPSIPAEATPLAAAAIANAEPRSADSSSVATEEIAVAASEPPPAPEIVETNLAAPDPADEPIEPPPEPSGATEALPVALSEVSTEPPLAIENSAEQGPGPAFAAVAEAAPIEMGEPPLCETTTEPEAIESAQPALDVRDDTVVAAPANTDIPPIEPHEPTAQTTEPAISAPDPGKTAILARFAEMLEQALTTEDPATPAPTLSAAPADPPSPPTPPAETLASDTAVAASTDVGVELGIAGTNDGPIVDGTAAEAPAAALSPTPPVGVSAEITAATAGLGEPDASRPGDDSTFEAEALPPIETDAPPIQVDQVSTEPQATPTPQFEPKDGPPDLGAPVDRDASESEVAGVARASVKVSDPARKAMLVRLAEMLERALSKRPAGTTPEPPAAVALPETSILAEPIVSAHEVDVVVPVAGTPDPEDRVAPPPSEANLIEAAIELDGEAESVEAFQLLSATELDPSDAPVARAGEPSQDTAASPPDSYEIREPAREGPDPDPATVGELRGDAAETVLVETTTEPAADLPPTTTEAHDRQIGITAKVDTASALERPAEEEPPAYTTARAAVAEVPPHLALAPVSASAPASDAAPATMEPLAKDVATAETVAPLPLTGAGPPTETLATIIVEATLTGDPPNHSEALELGGPSPDASSPATEMLQTVVAEAAQAENAPAHPERLDALEAPALDTSSSVTEVADPNIVEALGPEPATPSETLETIALVVPAASSPAVHAPEPIIVPEAVVASLRDEPVAPIEISVVEDVSLPPPAAADAPTPAQQEKATREALTDDLAEMIHGVLSTTQFATKALKPVRHSATAAEPVEEVALTDLAEELSAALPHPVAVRARLGTLERLVAFASVGMLIVAGYFAISLWRSGGGVSATQPAVAARAAPRAEGWGERARDIARDLGSISVATEVPKTQIAAPQAGPAGPAPPSAPQAGR